MRVFNDFNDLKGAVGTEVGVSDWMEITQDRINKFAEATGDEQWIHIDVERAARELPCGKTNADALLKLSLIPTNIGDIIALKVVKNTLNYGANRVRYLTPVPAGSLLIRSVCLRDQFRAQARQPCFPGPAPRCEQMSSLFHTRRTRVNAGEPIGVEQDVLATDLVVVQIEAEGGLRLGFAVELSLKGPDLIRCCQVHHQSPSPHHLRKARQKAVDALLHRSYTGINAPIARLIRRTERLCDPYSAILCPRQSLPRNYEPPLQRAVPTIPADPRRVDAVEKVVFPHVGLNTNSPSRRRGDLINVWGEAS